MSTDPQILLRARLAVLDEDRVVKVAARDAESAAALSATATAGSEYDEGITDAEESYQSQQGVYDEFLTTTSSNLEAAQGAIDDIETAPPVIPLITDVTITTGGAPDCSAADIQAAVNGALTQIRAAIEAIVEAIPNCDTEKVKGAMQKLKDVGQGFRDQMPAASDNEAAKTAAYAQLEGLF